MTQFWRYSVLVAAHLISISSISADVEDSFLNWYPVKSGTISEIRDIIYLTNTYVTAGYNILTSTDGTNWITRRSEPSDVLPAIAYGNGLFVAVEHGQFGQRSHVNSIISLESRGV